MKTLQLSDANARRLYKTAPEEFKTTLEDTFGKDFFSMDITDRVQSYEDACAELGRIPNNNETNRSMLETIIEALNEGWKPNWEDPNERKWIPFFVMAPSGFAFYASNFGYSFADAGSGSRLRLKSEKLSDYVGKKFLELWKAVQLD